MLALNNQGRLIYTQIATELSLLDALIGTSNRRPADREKGPPIESPFRNGPEKTTRERDRKAGTSASMEAG